MISSFLQRSVFQKTGRGIFGWLFLALFCTGFSSASASEVIENRDYSPSVSSFCSPQFVEVAPEKYSDIGEIETLSFTLQNNANPDSMSVRINGTDLPFSLKETKKGVFSGSIDVSEVENGRQIVSLYAQSNDAVRCSFRDYIYVLYKNKAENVHYPSLSEHMKEQENFDPLGELFQSSVPSTPEISREILFDDVKITFPAPDSTIYTMKENKQKISGIAPKGAKKIWVDFSDEHGKTEHYFLRKFSQGDTTWNYFASEQYSNLSRGLNMYRVYAEFADGKFSDAETITLFFPPENFTPDFPDTQNHWAKQAIHFLKSKGIVHGRENGKFFPDAAITKAESLKIATLSFNVKKHSYQENDFSDVQKSDWFADYASTAKAGKITGTKGDVLLPQQNVLERDAWNMIIDASLQKLDSEIAQDDFAVTRAEFSDAVFRLMK